MTENYEVEFRLCNISVYIEPSPGEREKEKR